MSTSPRPRRWRPGFGNYGLGGGLGPRAWPGAGGNLEPSRRLGQGTVSQGSVGRRPTSPSGSTPSTSARGMGGRNSRAAPPEVRRLRPPPKSVDEGWQASSTSFIAQVGHRRKGPRRKSAAESGGVAVEAGPRNGGGCFHIYFFGRLASHPLARRFGACWAVDVVDGRSGVVLGRPAAGVPPRTGAGGVPAAGPWARIVAMHPSHGAGATWTGRVPAL